MSQNAYMDDYMCTFKDEAEFIEFIKEYEANSEWITYDTNALDFHPPE